MRVINWFVFDFLMNTGIWIFAIMVALIFFSVRLYRRSWLRTEVNPILWGGLTFVAVIIVFVVFVIASNYIFNDLLHRPSRVDVSPIATINEEHFGRVENALRQLADQGYIRPLSFIEPLIIREDRPQNRSYSSGWISQPRFASNTSRMSIGIDFYEHESSAVSQVQAPQRLNPDSVYIRNRNNTDTLARYPWMSVSASGWYIPTELRTIRTEIRIGNVVISLREQRPWHDLRNDYSSLFIVALVEAIESLHDEP